MSIDLPFKQSYMLSQIETVKECTKAIELNPNYTKALVLRAEAHEKLEHFEESLTVKLNANRMVVGTLRGFDQFMNLVVDNTVEVNGDDKRDTGMVVIRGNNIVTVEAFEPVGRSS
ncbi:unnamed protein product [Eruca vesicaria subsp. sativa]|uniref:Probable small nuclear ribonucleoprotein G n=1 Tax=Eruca vesicaria subsp. sativa TaxID=29727 RepID=A0ABC8JIW6_ERUVS|nr:unnamed protein product [Eruca vesicaria subsp. sativa]